LLVHRLVKGFEPSEVRSLCSLIRVTNAHHINDQRFEHEDIVVPGPFVLAATCAGAVNDLGEILAEELVCASNVNPVNLRDLVCAVSYVLSVEPVPGRPGLECATVKTLGLKNVDPELIADAAWPPALFDPRLLRAAEIEERCMEDLPELQHRVACQLTRRILRRAS
jgi:hypothetical protein